LIVDPLTSTYPWLTPYQFAANKPIVAIDVDGLEALIKIQSVTVSKTFLRIQNNQGIEAATKYALKYVKSRHTTGDINWLRKATSDKNMTDDVAIFVGDIGLPADLTMFILVYDDAGEAHYEMNEYELPVKPKSLMKRISEYIKSKMGDTEYGPSSNTKRGRTILDDWKEGVFDKQGIEDVVDGLGGANGLESETVENREYDGDDPDRAGNTSLKEEASEHGESKVTQSEWDTILIDGSDYKLHRVDVEIIDGDTFETDQY